MPTLNAQLYINTFSDTASSNAPSLNNVRWCRDLIGLAVTNPASQALMVPAGQSVTVVTSTTPKRLIYLETSLTMTVSVNTVDITVAPLVTGTNIQPGIYLSSTPTTSLVLTNPGSVDAQVFVISAE